MRIFTKPKQLQAYINALKRDGRTVALVPTMGALHEGHAALLRRARKAADIVVLSIFVNPLQFGPAEDFEKYPRTMAADRAVAAREKADAIFAPRRDDLYPDGFSTRVEETELSAGLCGAARPGHFSGVTTVVAKLFNIVSPDLAFFGQKDYQQYKVIERMARDLDLPVRVVMVPTAREKDGLAMSSRNAYLSAGEREIARSLNGALRDAAAALKRGRPVGAVAAKGRDTLRKAGVGKIDYFEVREADSLKDAGKGDRRLAVLAAAMVGKTRLIDNMLVNRSVIPSCFKRGSRANGRLK